MAEVQHEIGPESTLDATSLAQSVLGQDLDYLQPPDPELWDEGRKIVYVATLRQLAQKRLEDRRQGKDMQIWMPDEAQLEDMRRNLHVPMGRLAMLNNAASWEKHDGRENGSLREHQKPVIDNYLSFLRECPPEARHGASPGMAGRLELPTGSGKSFLIQKIAAIIGIGKPVPYRSPLSGLAITSRSTIRDQLVELFRTEQPEVKLGTDFPRSDETKSDMNISSYASMLSAYEQEPVSQLNMDVVFTDEIHSGIGPNIWSKVEYTSRQSQLIAMTASPILQKKDVAQFIPYLIAEGDVAAYIESGILNSLHLFTHNTGIDRSELRASEVIVHKERNKMIVDLIVQCVEQGLQVYVSCLKGQSCRHGDILNEILRETDILDKVTGDARPIRSEVTNASKTKGTIRAIRHSFSEGTLDVILDTATLQEGFDSDRVGAVILTSPTSSASVLTQRLGRGLRYNRQRPVTVVHELIDNDGRSEGFKQVTCHHLLREPEIRAERFIGSVDDKRRRPWVSLRGGNRAVLGTISLDVLQKQEPVPPQEGWVRVDQLLQLADRTDLHLRTPQLRYLINKYTDLSCQVDGDGRGFYFVEPRAVEYIKNLDLSRAVPHDYATAVKISVTTGYSEWVIRRTAEQLSLHGERLRPAASLKTATYFSPEQQKQILDELNRYPAKGSEDLSLDEMVSQVKGASRYTLYDYLCTEGFSPSKRMRKDETRAYIDPVECYSTEALRAAQAHFSAQLIPEEAALLEVIRVELGIGQSAFNTHIRQLGLMDLVVVGKRRDGKGTARYVSSDIGEIIRNSFSKTFGPDSPTKVLPYYAKKYEITPKVVYELIQSQKLDHYLHERKTERATRRVYADAGQEQLEAVLEKYTKSTRGTRIAIKNGTRRLVAVGPQTVEGSPMVIDIEVPIPLEEVATYFGCSVQIFTKFLHKIQIGADGLCEADDGTVTVLPSVFTTVKNYVSYLKPAPVGWPTAEAVSHKLGVSRLDIVRRLGKQADYVLRFYRISISTSQIDLFIDPRHIHLIAKV
jgi:superfamily II DNA or RNA helicase